VHELARSCLENEELCAWEREMGTRLTFSLVGLDRISTGVSPFRFWTFGCFRNFTNPPKVVACESGVLRVALFVE